GRSPGPDEQAVPSSTILELAFSQPVNPGSFTSTAWEIRDDFNRLVPVRLRFQDSFHRVMVEPLLPWQHDTLYTVRLRPDLQGAGGAPLDSTNSWIFKTVPSPKLQDDPSLYGPLGEVKALKATVYPGPY